MAGPPRQGVGPQGSAGSRSARLAAAWFVLLLLTVGSFGLWIGVPAATRIADGRHVIDVDAEAQMRRPLI